MSSKPTSSQESLNGPDFFKEKKKSKQKANNQIFSITEAIEECFEAKSRDPNSKTSIRFPDAPRQRYDRRSKSKAKESISQLQVSFKPWSIRSFLRKHLKLAALLFVIWNVYETVHMCDAVIVLK